MTSSHHQMCESWRAQTDRESLTLGSDLFAGGFMFVLALFASPFVFSVFALALGWVLLWMWLKPGVWAKSYATALGAFQPGFLGDLSVSDRCGNSVNCGRCSQTDACAALERLSEFFLNKITTCFWSWKYLFQLGSALCSGPTLPPYFSSLGKEFFSSQNRNASKHSWKPI